MTRKEAETLQSTVIRMGYRDEKLQSWQDAWIVPAKIVIQNEPQ
jgi:hypothetical protein